MNSAMAKKSRNGLYPRSGRRTGEHFLVCVQKRLHLAFLCHPHPLYGGTMHNKVVYSMAMQP
jgi:alpha/beta superfamily hydrolase